MRCEDVEGKLLELIDEELSPAQRATVLAHLHDCRNCTVELSAYRDVLARVQIDPVPKPPPAFWEESLPPLQYRIEQEAQRPKPKPLAWLAGAGSWFALRPRFIASLAVAAVSIFVVVRLPGFLPGRADHRLVPVSTAKAVNQHDRGHNGAMVLRPDGGIQPAGEPLIVAGEMIEDPSVLVAAIQRLGWANEMADRLETAWVLSPESDPSDALASLNEKERQILFDRMRDFQWSQS